MFSVTLGSALGAVWVAGYDESEVGPQSWTVYSSFSLLETGRC